MPSSIDKWFARYEHLRTVRAQRHEPPTFKEVAAEAVREGDRWLFGGHSYTVTAIATHVGWVVLYGEFGDRNIVAEYLPFESLQVAVPRPPALEETSR